MLPFHLAIPVKYLALCRELYGKTLDCSEGRSSDQWVDFNFFGHQLVLNSSGSFQKADSISNPVDKHDVPVPYFGVVLAWDDWEIFAQKMKDKNIAFIIEPGIRFEGELGEQATMFFNDPEQNALEFKAFRNIDQLFAK